MLAEKRQQTRPTKSSGKREELRKRTREILSQELSFIPNPAFLEMDEAKYFREILSRDQRSITHQRKRTRKDIADAQFENLCQAPLLNADEERELFRAMNYMKFRANRIRSTLNASRPSARKLADIEETLNKAEELRNAIVEANTRLIVSIVKKLADEKHTFDEMLSDGLTSLMKAVEKFDYDKGFRFSTYATMVVRRALYRQMERTQKVKTRFVSGQAEVLDGQHQESADAGPTESQLTSRDKQLGAIMQKLDERERLIVEARCGFVDLGMKATFANLGDQLGVCKERVRQLELRAMEKLRTAIVELGLVMELREFVVG